VEIFDTRFRIIRDSYHEEKIIENKPLNYNNTVVYFNDELVGTAV